MENMVNFQKKCLDPVKLFWHLSIKRESFIYPVAVEYGKIPTFMSQHFLLFHKKISLLESAFPY